MVLLHGGSPRGCRAHRWADHRKVAQVVFKPDWNRHRNAAPLFKGPRTYEASGIRLKGLPPDLCEVDMVAHGGTLVSGSLPRLFGGGLEIAQVGRLLSFLNCHQEAVSADVVVCLCR